MGDSKAANTVLIVNEEPNQNPTSHRKQWEWLKESQMLKVLYTKYSYYL